MTATTIPSKTLQSGFSMPVYGMGTWEMGGRSSHDPGNDDAADLAALKVALEAGVTHFDTAEMYAAGHAEGLLGRAISEWDRKSLMIVSKVSPGNQDPQSLRRSLERSLDRIGTDYLDVYMPHRYDPEVPLDETMGALDEVVDEGLVLHIAVSNYSVDQLERARAVARHPIVFDQVYYSISSREPERNGLLDYCDRTGVLLAAWRPVEKGALDSGAPLFSELCQKYAKTPAQIAINWLVSQSQVVTLSKTRDPNHLRENLGALNWAMDPDDIERVRKELET